MRQTQYRNDRGMQAGAKPKAAGRPRLDGRRVLFEVQADGRSIPCAISFPSLQDIGMRRHLRPEDALQCFEQARPRIEAAALHKLHSRAPATGGVLNVWADDLEEAPEEENPAPDPQAG
jgi:hypothetical protein